jgi:hypothetical protein
MVTVKAAISPVSNNSTNGADSGRGPSSEESQSLGIGTTGAALSASGLDVLETTHHDSHRNQLHQHQQQEVVTTTAASDKRDDYIGGW